MRLGAEPPACPLPAAPVQTLVMVPAAKLPIWLLGSPKLVWLNALVTSALIWKRIPSRIRKSLAADIFTLRYAGPNKKFRPESPKAYWGGAVKAPVSYHSEMEGFESLPDPVRFGLRLS